MRKTLRKGGDIGLRSWDSQHQLLRKEVMNPIIVKGGDCYRERVIESLDCKPGNVNIAQKIITSTDCHWLSQQKRGGGSAILCRLPMLFPAQVKSAKIYKFACL